ncbi:hypothetical protein B296_00020085 [Ensete ventricosum]|uniref:Uncharacterized protein n=1 Tax=Ensete ventricosum TaxID=4639 RepID=A0A426YEV0_ENSVE|nr:hypothetical protein B296_00020085 [Ensete ventricosum]
MLPRLGSRGRINLGWEGTSRVAVEGEAWLWPVSSMANPSFSSDEAPTKMVERCEHYGFFENSAKRSLCSSATETSGSRRGPRSGKLRWALRLLGLGRATTRLTTRGLRRWFDRRQTEGDYFCRTEPLSMLNERSIGDCGFTVEESTDDGPIDALIPY